MHTGKALIYAMRLQTENHSKQYKARGWILPEPAASNATLLGWWQTLLDNEKEPCSLQCKTLFQRRTLNPTWYYTCLCRNCEYINSVSGKGNNTTLMNWENALSKPLKSSAKTAFARVVRNMQRIRYSWKYGTYSSSSLTASLGYK